MPNREPREMRDRAQKMREMAESFGDLELQRLLREQADNLESLADEMTKMAGQ